MTEALTRIVEEYQQTRKLSTPTRHLIVEKSLDSAQPPPWSQNKERFFWHSVVPLWMLRGHFPSCPTNITFEQLVDQAVASELVKAARRFFTPLPRLIVQLEGDEFESVHPK